MSALARKPAAAPNPARNAASWLYNSTASAASRVARRGMGEGAIPNLTMGLLQAPIDMAQDGFAGHGVSPLKSASKAVGSASGAIAESGVRAYLGGAATRRWGVDLLANAAAPNAAHALGRGALAGAGGAVSGGIESVARNGYELYNGQTDLAGAAAEVMVDTGRGAFTGIGGGLGAALGSMVCPGIGTAVGGFLGGMAAGALLDWTTADDHLSTDLASTFRGDKQAPRSTTVNLGAQLGSAAGSLFGPIGSMAGAAIGGLAASDTVPMPWSAAEPRRASAPIAPRTAPAGRRPTTSAGRRPAAARGTPHAPPW